MEVSSSGQVEYVDVPLTEEHAVPVADDASGLPANEILVHFEPATGLSHSSIPRSAAVYGYACDSLACGVCGATFNHLTSFLFHKSLHELAAKTFRCELCNKMMSCPESLKRHYVDHHKVAMLFNRVECESSSQSITECIPESTVAKSDNPIMNNVVYSYTAEHPGHEVLVNEGEESIHDALVQNPHCSDQVHIELVRDPPGDPTADMIARSADMGPVQNDGSHPQIIQQTVDMQTRDARPVVVSRAEPCFHDREHVVVKQDDAAVDEAMETSAAQEVHVHVQQSYQHSQGSDIHESYQVADQPQDPSTPERSSSVRDNRSSDVLFLLITETGVKETKPFTTHWYCCLLCTSYKTRHRNGMQTHMEAVHPNRFPSQQDVRHPHPIEQSFDLNTVSLEKQVLTLKEYDFQRPVVGNNVKRKLETQDIPGSYPCPHCNKVFSRVRYLRRHKLTHQKGDVISKCEQCHSIFKSARLLEKHENTVHKKCMREYQCKQCDFQSTNKILIHNHRQIHNSDSVICDMCGLAYCDRSTLKKHMEVHDPTRPFICSFPECNWRFKSEVMRNAHIRAHTTVGKFKCNTCLKHFRHKHHLQRHEKSCHGVTSDPSKHNETLQQSSIHQVGEFVEVPSTCVELQMEEGEQVLMVPGDLGALQGLINLKEVEVVLWPPSVQAD